MKILAYLLCIFLYSCGEKKPSYLPQKKLSTALKEAYIIEKMPIDTIWLAKALTYEGDTLPKELRSYLKPLLPERLFASPIIFFEYKEVNLDADSEKEKLVSFYHRYVASDCVSTLFLDKVGKNWSVQNIVQQPTRYSDNMKMLIDTSQKVVFLKRGLWGSGSGGYACYLYKNIGKTYKEIVYFTLLQYYSMTGYAGLATQDSVSHRFIDDKHIELVHYFNIMVKYPKDECLIKNKVRKELLVWNDEKQIFESKQTQEELSSFSNECTQILKQIYKNASSEIKKGMWEFAMQTGLIATPPKK